MRIRVGTEGRLLRRTSLPRRLLTYWDLAARPHTPPAHAAPLNARFRSPIPLGGPAFVGPDYQRPALTCRNPRKHLTAHQCVHLPPASNSWNAPKWHKPGHLPAQASLTGSPDPRSTMTDTL